MIDKKTVDLMSRVSWDAKLEAEFLDESIRRDLVTKQRFINAGLTFQRLAQEMFVAAGSFKEE